MTCRFLPSAIKVLSARSALIGQQMKTVAPVPRCSRQQLIHTTSCQRFDDRGPNADRPKLMNHPREIVWPSVFRTIHNYMQSALIIRPYMDNDFSLSEFSAGAKQALLVISSHLAKGDTEGLKGLVDDNALDEIKTNLNGYDYKKRLDLEVKSLEDVYLSFPYQVGIIMNDTTSGVQERFVEITYVFHVFRGLSELAGREDFQPGPTNMAKYRDRIMICNYRFIREFTKGVQGQWLVNLVHHFQLEE